MFYVQTHNEYDTVLWHMAACARSIRFHDHTFEISRRTRLPHSTRFDAIERCWHSCKIEKCEFFTNRIDYIGHFIKLGWFEFRSHTIDVIHGVQAPFIFSELLSSLDLCNIFRRFVPILAGIAARLNNKLERYQSYLYI